jgi:hypothetical protein
VQHSYIHDAGRSTPGYGEDLYFGSAQSNWPKYGENGGTGPDRGDRDQALNNTFGPNVTAGHIDIKEGATGGLASGNTFDGRGISGQHYADSWIDAKGNNYLFQGNVGTFVAGIGTLADGVPGAPDRQRWNPGDEFRWRPVTSRRPRRPRSPVRWRWATGTSSRSAWELCWPIRNLTKIERHSRRGGISVRALAVDDCSVGHASGTQSHPAGMAAVTSTSTSISGTASPATRRNVWGGREAPSSASP